MRTIHLNKRQARMLRDNLTNNSEGYDYTDLVRLDHLAKKLDELQGEYAIVMADQARQEKAIRRQLVRGQVTQAEAERVLLDITYSVEDLTEQAEAEPAELLVEDGDWKLIKDKLGNVSRWLGSDALRHVIIGMVQAVEQAESDEPVDAKVKSIRR